MWWVPIVVAVITGPIVVVMKRFDTRNTDQHAENQKVLLRIETKVDHSDTRLDDHSDYHLKEGL